MQTLLGEIVSQIEGVNFKEPDNRIFIDKTIESRLSCIEPYIVKELFVYMLRRLCAFYNNSYDFNKPELNYYSYKDEWCLTLNMNRKNENS